MKKVLVISHMANIPGCCQAEWVDDRVYELLNRAYKITVISGAHCFKYKEEIQHLRIPSVLPYEAKAELNEIESYRIDLNTRPMTLGYLRLMRKLSNLLYFLKINLFKGEGRWFWMFSSLGMGVKNMCFQKYDIIYTTGGPASAHLTGIFLSKIFGTKLIAELQDPLTGEDIGRNRITIRGLAWVEKFIIKNANHVIFATENASIAAKLKYHKEKDKIEFIYPGAKKINIEPLDLNTKKTNKVNFSYIGSLYQTRNLDNFFEALKNIHTSTDYEINLYGWIADDILQRIKDLNNKKIIIHGMISREEAIANAKKADVLLLVQHTDLRSVKTIPFKIYDYLNSGNIIFGLTYKNKEIDVLLNSHGHLTSNASDVRNIETKLEQLLTDIDNIKKKIKPSILTPENAVNEMEKLF